MLLFTSSQSVSFNIGCLLGQLVCGWAEAESKSHSVHMCTLNLRKVCRIFLLHSSSRFSSSHHVFQRRSLPPTVNVSVVNKQQITCTHHAPHRTGEVTMATKDISTFGNDTKLGNQQLQCPGKAGQWPNINSWTGTLCLLLKIAQEYNQFLVTTWIPPNL